MLVSCFCVSIWISIEVALGYLSSQSHYCEIGCRRRVSVIRSGLRLPLDISPLSRIIVRLDVGVVFL